MKNAIRIVLACSLFLTAGACATGPGVRTTEPHPSQAPPTVLPPVPPAKQAAAPPKPEPAEQLLGEMDALRSALSGAGELPDTTLARARQLASRLPDHYYPWQLLGLATLRNGQKVLAADAFGKAVFLRPDDHVSRRALGWLSLESGDLAAAEEHYLSAYRASPDPHTARVLAYVMIRGGRLDTAQSLLESLRSVAPDDPFVLNNMAVALDAMGHTAWALTILEGSGGKSAALLATRSMLELKEGLLDEAADDLDAGLSMAPVPDSTLLAGLLLLQRGRIEDAVSSFREFVAQNPGRPEGYVNLGLALRRLGRFSEAKATYEEGLQKAAIPELYLNLGTLMELYRGDAAAALENYLAYVRTQGAGAQRVQGWIDYLSGLSAGTGQAGDGGQSE